MAGPTFPKFRGKFSGIGGQAANVQVPGLPYQKMQRRDAAGNVVKTKVSGDFVDVRTKKKEGLFFAAFRDSEAPFVPVDNAEGPSSINEVPATRHSVKSASESGVFGAAQDLPPAWLLHSAGFRVGGGRQMFVSAETDPAVQNMQVGVSVATPFKTLYSTSVPAKIDRVGVFQLVGDTWGSSGELPNAPAARPSAPARVFVPFAARTRDGQTHIGLGTCNPVEHPAFVKIGKDGGQENISISQSAGSAFNVTRVGPHTLIGFYAAYTDQRDSSIPDNATNTLSIDSPAFGRAFFYRQVRKPALAISNDNGDTWKPVLGPTDEIPRNLWWDHMTKVEVYSAPVFPGSLSVSTHGAKNSSQEEARLLLYKTVGVTYRSSAISWNEYLAHTVYRSIILPETEQTCLVLRYVYGDQFLVGRGGAFGFAAYEKVRTHVLSSWAAFNDPALPQTTAYLGPDNEHLTHTWTGSATPPLPGIGGPESPRATLPNFRLDTYAMVNVGGQVNYSASGFYRHSYASPESEFYDTEFGVANDKQNRLFEVWRVDFGGSATRIKDIKRPSATVVNQRRNVYAPRKVQFPLTPSPLPAPAPFRPGDLFDWAAPLLSSAVIKDSDQDPDTTTPPAGIAESPRIELVDMPEVIQGDDSPFSTCQDIAAAPRVFVDFSSGRAKYLITDRRIFGAVEPFRRQYVTDDFVTYARLADEPAKREFFGERRWLDEKIVAPIYAGLVTKDGVEEHEYHLLRSEDLGGSWEKIAVLYRGPIGEPAGSSTLSRFNTVEWTYDSQGRPADLNPYSGAWVCDERVPGPKFEE